MFRSLPTPSRSKWRRVAVAATAALTMLGIVVVAEPAMAASCFQASCNAKDPQAEGCANGATTIDDLYDVGYYLELRYSSACDAAWVRANSEGGWQQTGVFKLERYDPSSYFSITFGPGQSGTKWTRMYSFRYLLRGSLDVSTSTGYNPPTFYTAWH